MSFSLSFSQTRKTAIETRTPDTESNVYDELTRRLSIPGKLRKILTLDEI